MERAQHRSLGGIAGEAVVDCIYQHRHTQSVRKQTEFLPGVRAFLTDTGQETDRLSPFVLTWLHLAHEIVQVADHCLTDDALPEIGRTAYSFQHRLGYGRFVEISHRCLLCLSLEMKRGWLIRHAGLHLPMPLQASIP